MIGERHTIVISNEVIGMHLVASSFGNPGGVDVVPVSRLGDQFDAGLVIGQQVFVPVECDRSAVGFDGFVLSLR